MISIHNKLTHSRVLGTNKQVIQYKPGSLLFNREYESILIPIAKTRTKYYYPSSDFGNSGTTKTLLDQNKFTGLDSSNEGFGSSDYSKTLLAPGQTFTDARSFVNTYPFTLQPIMQMIIKKYQSLLPVKDVPAFTLIRPGPSTAEILNERILNTPITPDGSPESDIITNAMSEYQPFTWSFSTPILPIGNSTSFLAPAAPQVILPTDLKATLIPNGDFHNELDFYAIPQVSKPGFGVISWRIRVAEDYVQRQAIWDKILSYITNFKAYSQPTQTQFSEYFVDNVSNNAPGNPPNSITYYVVHDNPPAPSGASFNPAPNTVEFWSLFFTYPEGLDFLSTAAQKGPREFQVMDTVFSQVPSSEKITDTPQYTRYDFILGMNDFTIKTYPGNRIKVFYDRNSKSESFTFTKSKESFMKFIAMAVGIAIVSAMTMAIASPATFSALVGANSVSAAASAAAGTTGAAIGSSTPALTLATSGGGLASIGAAPTLGSFAVSMPVISTSTLLGASSGSLLTTLGTIGLTTAKTLGPQLLQGMLASKPVINTQQPIPSPSAQPIPPLPSNAIILNSSKLVYAGQGSSGQSVYTIALPNGNSLNITLSRQLQPNEINSAYLTPIACNDDSTKQCYSFVVPNVVTINDNNYSAQSLPAQPQQSIAMTPVTQPTVLPSNYSNPSVLPPNYSNMSVLPSNYSQPSVIPSATQTNAPTTPTTTAIPMAAQAGMLGGSMPLLLIGGIAIFFLFGLKKPKQGIIEKTQITNKEQK